MSVASNFAIQGSSVTYNFNTVPLVPATLFDALPVTSTKITISDGTLSFKGSAVVSGKTRTLSLSASGVNLVSDLINFKPANPVTFLTTFRGSVSGNGELF